ncbi:MAG TPA: sugar phosphate isomerase/epimerase [Prolixibacteraceae bacterium]|nr:sugar phosphate isomerase/epimerase [Prolixibacteraceae bacterium]
MTYRIVLFLLLIFGIGTVHAKKNKQLFPEAPGMVSYTFRNSFAKDVAKTLDTLKTLGIQDMEFSSLFGKQASEIRKMLDEREMYCSSFGVSYPDLVTKTREVGENAKTLGAKYVRVAYIAHEGIFTPEMAQKAVNDFNKAGKILMDEYGISFCYHNHGYECVSYENGTLMDYMIQQSDPKYVNFEIDILWSFIHGADPAKLIAKYPERFRLLHLKDLRQGAELNASGGTAVENDVALGTGQLNIPSILKVAKKAGIKHYYIEDESPSYASQVPQSMIYLKSLKE